MNRFRVVILAVLVMTLAGLAMAAPQDTTLPPGTPTGEPHQGPHDPHAQFKESPSVQWLADTLGVSLAAGYWISVLINFAIMAGLIWLLARKALPALLRGRTASIQREMEEARRASQEAQARLADVEGRLARLDSEIAEIRAIAETEATREEQRLRDAAEEDRRKIVQAAEQEIASMANQARRELRAYAADLAVSLAEQKIQVSAEADRKLVSDFAGQLTNGSPKDGR